MTCRFSLPLLHAGARDPSQPPPLSHALMTMSPSGPWSSLSMPLGPREVRRTRDTALAAWMLDLTASMPFTRLCFSCSCSTAKG